MNALQYAQDLVAFPSVSRDSNLPVSDYVQEVLQRLGFDIERLEYDDPKGVRKANILGKKGDGQGGLAYFGHTDVVPADDWRAAGGPFQPRVADGRLYGRGSCDMKGSVACMLAAAETISQQPLKQPLYVVCTADEEVGYGGAKQVAARSALFAEMVQQQTRAVIGEPTCLEVVHGHKGGAAFTVVSHGKAAHSSTNEGLNANWAMIPFLAEMKQLYERTENSPQWRDSRFDPPTISCNLGMNDHTAAINITPARSVCTVHFRPMPGQNLEELAESVQQAAQQHGLQFEENIRVSAMFVEPQSGYIQELLKLTQTPKSRTVSYGTDGSILTDLKQMAVLGPGDIAQAHTVDEWIDLQQLERGQALYEQLIRHWCLDSSFLARRPKPKNEE